MQLTNRRVHLMGTVIDVSIYHKQPEPLLDQVESLLNLYNKRFSANDDSSELMKINKAAGLHPVKIHPELFELISLGKWHSCQPGSHLNIAIGPLIQTWRIGFSDARLPFPEEITLLLDIINPNAIVLSEENQSVFLQEKGMKIDLGALAKGYIADRIADFLKAEKVTSALINLGGNVLTFGPALHNPDQKWRIGIQNPKETRNTNLLVLAIRDQSVVTSGIYERTFEIDGKSCTDVRIEQAYKGNFHLYASIDGRDCKFIIGKNKPEYATIQETGLSNLPESMLRDLVAKYLVR